MPRRSPRIWTGSASSRRGSSSSRNASPTMTRRRRSCGPPAVSIPATKRPTNSTAGASGSWRADLPPVYDRAALKLTDEERAQLEAEGRKPHWRFKLDHATVEWNDLIRGPQHIDTASLSDPVLVREDGSYLYTLPSVVDDIDFGITHVIRGEDHVVNTAVQIEITQALGGAVPSLCASQPADRRRRQGTVEAAGFALDRRHARTGPGGDGGGEPRGAARHVRLHSSVRGLQRSWSTASISPSCRARRPASTRRNCVISMPSCCTCCRGRR